MGHHQSSCPQHPSSRIHYAQQNWLLLQKFQSNVTGINNYTIIKNKITNQVLRSYVVHFDNKKDFDVYVEEFDDWRAMGRWNVLEAKYLVVDSEGFGLGGLCSSLFRVKIFLQNPVVTLSEIKDIPVAQSFYILLSALVGFQHLFQVFGYFQLTQKMITINQKGLVKVWIHPDLSQNRPHYLTLNHLTSQNIQNPTHFILELVELIQTNTDSHQLPTSFREFIHTNRNPKYPLTFSNCRKLLLNFAQDNKIDIPDSLIQILDLLFEKTNKSCISQLQNFMNDEHQTDALYGINYMADGYLLDRQDNEYDEMNYQGHNYDEMGQDNDFTSGDHSNQHDYKLQSGGEMIQSFQHYPQSNQQISRQLNEIVKSTKSNHNNQTPSQSSNHISSRKISYNNLKEAKNMVVAFPRQSSSPTSHYEDGNYQQNSHEAINTNAYQNPPQRVPQLPLIINFTQNSGTIIQKNENPYQSLVQKETHERQSTIREQLQEDSFLTSNRNSKFQTSRDLRRTSNNLKKTYKNIQSHRQTFSSHSDTKMNIENHSPRHPHTIDDSQSIKNRAQYRFQTKRSGKSIQFYTINQMKEIDAQIAQDLEDLMTNLRDTKRPA